jgi:hypothetical protein
MGEGLRRRGLWHEIVSKLRCEVGVVLWGQTVVVASYSLIESG